MYIDLDAQKKICELEDKLQRLAGLVSDLCGIVSSREPLTEYGYGGVQYECQKIIDAIEKEVGAK